MSILTFSQAAQVSRVSRSTIYRYAQKGRINPVRLPNGKRSIDTAELERVFGPLKKLDISQDVPTKQGGTVKTQADVSQERSGVIELLSRQLKKLFGPLKKLDAYLNIPTKPKEKGRIAKMKAARSQREAESDIFESLAQHMELVDGSSNDN